MKSIIKYKAIDGREFDFEEECEKHERLLVQIERAIKPLGSPPKEDGCSFANGGGYLQHDLPTVEAVKLALIDLAAVPENVKEGVRTRPASHSIIGRYLDDGDSPVRKGWYRLMCIDEQGREWGQPFYALHPEQATQVRLN